MLRYPLNRLDATCDYFKITIAEYKPGGGAQSASGSFKVAEGSQANSPKKNKSVKEIILLPIPNNLVDSNTTGWGEDSINSMAAKGVQEAQKVMKSGTNAINQAKGSISDIYASVKGSKDEFGRAANAYFASEAVNALGANTSANGILARTTGQIINPNQELLFNGVSIRSFSYTFDLIPRSLSEGNQVKMIIRAFKKHMAAKKSPKGVFLGSPDIFQLEFMSGAKPHPFLHRFKPCACTNVSVNYTGAGAYSTYEDSTPIHMTLTVSFQELNPVYFEDYELAGGVGF